MRATLGCMIALRAVLGTGQGEIITPAFSFVATAHAARWLGLDVVFADIDPETLNIDPEDVERRITPRTRAILPVHCYAGSCDVAALAGAGAGEQGRGDALGRLDCGQFVGQDRAHKPGSRVIGAALDAGQSGEGLDERVVDRFAGPVALEPEPRYGGVYDIGAYGPHGCFAQADPLGDAGSEVLNEDVRRFAQP